VFTKNIDAAHRMARGIRAGTVSVNCYAEGDITTPFGGYEQSGFGGRDKGIEPFDQYTDKTMWFALGWAGLRAPMLGGSVAWAYPSQICIVSG
jgi:gamma-glutamyl-gamma-aminobutyraldehyde dehydrogenase